MRSDGLAENREHRGSWHRSMLVSYDPACSRFSDLVENDRQKHAGVLRSGLLEILEIVENGRIRSLVRMSGHGSGIDLGRFWGIWWPSGMVDLDGISHGIWDSGKSRESGGHDLT
jgi:hypothetical protein